jgi:hypothetical protein
MALAHGTGCQLRDGASGSQPTHHAATPPRRLRPAAPQAYTSLQGRTFDGRVVSVRYITDEEFDTRAAAEHS